MAQVQHFVDQLTYVEAHYTAAGVFGGASNIDLLARGAIYGQMLGHENNSATLENPGRTGTFDVTIADDPGTQSDGTTGADLMRRDCCVKFIQGPKGDKISEVEITKWCKAHRTSDYPPGSGSKTK